MTNAIEGQSSGALPGKAPASAPGPADCVRCGAASSLAAGVRSATRMFADFLDRIVNGIRCIAPLVLSIGLGCQSTNDPVLLAPPAAAIMPVPAEPPRVAEPRQLGKFTITFYYVV